MHSAALPPTSETASPFTAATLRQHSRRPFHLQGRAVGSVATDHLPLLQAAGEAGAPVQVLADRVQWTGSTATQTADFDALNRRLRDQGAIRAWRDEPFAIFCPSSGAVLGHFERAASRFWGTLTLGAHTTGYVADAQGQPQALWIAQRALDKATDPGLFDNLIGGGVPLGQSPHQALVREGWEEAGATDTEMALARPASVLTLQRDVAEGLQFEQVHSFDLPLPAHWRPQNQDGEVAGFRLMAPAEAQALALAGAMTVDAALVTLCFLQRHGLWQPDAGQASALHGLRATAPVRLG
jgi:8-oxo-dGTP pyrophosphatase MutT (NUDIX family)